MRHCVEVILLVEHPLQRASSLQSVDMVSVPALIATPTRTRLAHRNQVFRLFHARRRRKQEFRSQLRLVVVDTRAHAPACGFDTPHTGEPRLQFGSPW